MHSFTLEYFRSAGDHMGRRLDLGTTFQKGSPCVRGFDTWGFARAFTYKTVKGGTGVRVSAQPMVFKKNARSTNLL